jgi:hypothetical protein
MTVRGINVKSLVFAGLTAGYIMYFVDRWFQGTLGLFGAFPGTSNPWWMLEHHLDSILFALAFAWPALYGRPPGAGWLKGLVFGLAWTILLSVVSLVAGGLGAETFQQIPRGTGPMASMIVLHLVWGFFLGVLCSPSRGDTQSVGG